MTSKKSTPAATSPGPQAQPAAGQGMPERPPREQTARTDKQITVQDSAVEASLKLPSDRDQSSDMTGSRSTSPRSPEVEQAGRDVGKGLKDTSSAPELDRTYKKL